MLKQGGRKYKNKYRNKHLQESKIKRLLTIRDSK